MSRSTRGSQKWIQVAVNEKQAVLDSAISKVLQLDSNEQIIWKSPLASDGYREYRDQTFIRQLGVELGRRKLSDFWPRRGPHWDALAKTSDGRLLLVEAKAHIREMVSSPTKASVKSSAFINSSLLEARRFLGVKKDVNWAGWFYQYTNRLAHLYLLRELNGLPAELIFLCFVNDRDMNGPTSVDKWEGAIEMLEVYLGLRRDHRLSQYVHHVYIDVQDLD